MSYAGISDVIIRYPMIKTMIGSAQFDVASVDVSSVYVAQAESYVDGWLARRYNTPLSFVPPLITQVTADLAIFNLLAERTAQVPQFIQTRYDRCCQILQYLADGTMTLGNSVSAVSSQGDNFAWSRTMGKDPYFDPSLGDLDQAEARLAEDGVIDELAP